MVFEHQTLSGPGELNTMSPGCLPVYLCLSFMVSLMKTLARRQERDGIGWGWGGDPCQHSWQCEEQPRQHRVSLNSCLPLLLSSLHMIANIVQDYF